MIEKQIMTAKKIRIVKKLRSEGESIMNIKALTGYSCQEILEALKK